MSGPNDKTPSIGQAPIIDHAVDDAVDERFLEEYLKGKSTVSQQYRQLSVDEVPADLDRQVLRQAHDAVKGRKPSRLNVWRRWSAPLALAASAVLVVSIVIESGVHRESMLMAPQKSLPAESIPASGLTSERERDAREEEKVVDVELKSIAPPPPIAPMFVPEAPTLAMEPAPVVTMPAPAAAAPAPEAQEVVVTARRSVSQVQNSPSAAFAISEDDTAADIQDEVTTAVQATTQAQPPPVLARSTERGTARAPKSAEASGHESRDKQEAFDLSEVVITGARRRPVQLAGPRSTIAIPERSYEDEAPEASLAGSLMRQYTDPAAWLSDIRQLRKDDKQEEADREWRRFREAFPNYEVSETDIARGNKKP